LREGEIELRNWKDYGVRGFETLTLTHDIASSACPESRQCPKPYKVAVGWRGTAIRLDEDLLGQEPGTERAGKVETEVRQTWASSKEG